MVLTFILKSCILVNVERTWSFSSAGRASALQAGGHRFEPYSDHHFSFLARQFSWLERQPVTLEVDGSSPFRVAIFLYKILFLARQLSWQSRGLKIPVSVVRFHFEPPKKVVVKLLFLFFIHFINTLHLTGSAKLNKYNKKKHSIHCVFLLILIHSIHSSRHTCVTVMTSTSFCFWNICNQTFCSKNH